MSKRRYPFYSGSTKLRAGTVPHCDWRSCEKDAEREVRVQFSWFRGDDGIWVACSLHADYAKNRLDEFLANVPPSE